MCTRGHAGGTTVSYGKYRSVTADGPRAVRASQGEDRPWVRQNREVTMDRLQQLRIAIHEGDGMALLAVLGGRVWAEVIQLAGDAVVQAVKHNVPGSAELAGGWIDALRERDWAGDDELAVDMEAALGRRPEPALKKLAVDLEELSMLLEAGFGEDGGVIDLHTGEVWRASTIEYCREEVDGEAPDFDDPDRCLYVGPEGSGEGYRDMEDFVASVTDAGRADRLAIAIEGRGAFRRFKDVISRWPDEQERWYRFSDERCRGRARQWLTGAGYRTVPAPSEDAG